MKDIRKGLWLIAIGTWLFVAQAFAGDHPIIPQKAWARACTYTINGTTGDPMFGEPIWVVAERPYVDEDGNAKSEWWVKFPNRPELHARGLAINWPQEKTIFMDGRWLGQEVPRVVKGKTCPLWGQTVQNVADH